MSYIVGANHPRTETRYYHGPSKRYRLRVEAKARAFNLITGAKRSAARLETNGWTNVQVIKCEGWGRPKSKKKASAK